MNAPTRFDLARASASPTPADLELTIRDRRFGRDAPPSRRHWANGDPVATAWFTALSATFPRGEGYFIESVKAFREGAPPRLADEIRAFIRQEVNHTREHVAFNRMAEAAGYDIAAVDARVKELLDVLKDRPAILDLAATMALEHYTAMFAHELLTNPAHLDGADHEFAELWRWHAVEEIEHKGVAYDTWLHATRDWSRWRRWRVKAIVMLLVSWRFIGNRVTDMIEMLRQDGITGWRARWRIAKYLLGRPGFLRRIARPWAAWFLPGFHPWNHDDRALIGRYDSEFEGARAA